ncbi:MAG: GTPase [Myxococcales bacterium]
MLQTTLDDSALEEILASVRRRFSLKPKVAIAGFGKAGKSTLFNAIYGEAVAAVSMKTDQTTEARTLERFGIDFTDTPGIGTSRFSFEQVAESGVFDGQHVVIHVLNGTSAISAEDERLHDAIERSQARRITVINKADLLEERERGEYAESVRERLGIETVLFVSAKRGEGLSALVERIAELLPEAMQDAFIGQQIANLQLKERRVRALVYAKAALSAGVALAPLPGADILFITPIQLAMVAAIGHFHGVEVDRTRAVELIATLGAGVGFRESARQLIKLVPGYGSVVSAGIAFAGTVALGEAANAWFKSRMKLDPAVVREVFKDTAERARREYAERGGAGNSSLVRKAERLRARFEAGELSREELERQLATAEEGED